MLKLSSPGARFFAAALTIVVSASLAFSGMTDLTTVGSSDIINGAEFLQFDPDSATGTGLINSFVRLQAKGTESGYNTGGDLEFDTKGGAFTHSLALQYVPEVDFGGVIFREFLLDINEGGGPNRLISLDELKIYVEDAPDQSGYPGAFGTAIYDMDAGGDNWVKLDASLNSGSGSGDMIVLIPSDWFGDDDSKYVYLYSTFGENESSEGGFEEWAVGEEGLSVEAPEPATLLVMMAAGLPVLLKRRRRHLLRKRK